MRLLGVLAVIAALGAAAAPARPGAATGAGADAEGALELALGADGTLSASGALPEGMTPAALEAALPGIDLSGLGPATDPATGPATGAPGREVAPALDALAIVLPRFRTAEVQVRGNALALEGTLRSGLSAAGVEAALRAALGTGWRLDLRLAETAPTAEIVLSQSGEGIAVSGLLPAGLGAPEALELLPRPAVDIGLAGGGDGSARAWSGALAALGETLDLFAAATARVASGEVEVRGVLRPGYPAEEVAERIRAGLPEGWRVMLDAEETTPSEGDRRVSLATGAPESFRRGYWLPEVDFPVSPERCAAETDAVLAGEGLPFDDGARIGERGLPLLDRLAAIAVRCLNSSPLRLEIGGHTDSVGNDARNEALSHARAEAVRQALLDRGVREDAVSARGYGESRPVATNNSPEGRARNRRIGFTWSEPG